MLGRRVAELVGKGAKRSHGGFEAFRLVLFDETGNADGALYDFTDFVHLAKRLRVQILFTLLWRRMTPDHDFFEATQLIHVIETT